MALRRGEKNNRQLNKRNVRRPAGRTAEFFDLRETDMNTGSDRSKGPEDVRGSYGGYENSGSPRPYRERHRVEVNSQGYDRYRVQDTANTFGGSADYNAGGSADYYAGQQRIVRGNVPGNRSGQTQRTPGEQSSPELLYDSRTAGNRRNTGRTFDRVQGRNPSAGRAASRGRMSAFNPYARGGRTTAYDPFDYDQRDYEEPRSEYEELPEEDGPEYDGLYGQGPDDSDEETVERREVLGRRLRQRAQARKLREQQLRSIYIRIGAGAAILLLLLIFIIPRIAGGHRSGKKEPENREQGQAVAEAQDSSETVTEENETQASPAEGNGPEAEDGNAGAAEAAQDADSNQAQPQDNTAGQTQTPDNTAGQTQAQDNTAGQTQAQSSDGTAAQQTQESAAQAGQENPAGGQGATAQSAPAQNAQNSVVSDTPVTVSAAPVQTAAASGLYTKQDDWRFILVNPWYMLPEEYAEVTTSTLPNGESVDSRCYGDFVKMLDDCRAAGGEPVVCSSYRPHAKQVSLYEDQVKSLMASGKTKEQAEAEAGTVVAVPGTSEHELGLAVDLCDFDYQNLDDAQGDTVTQKWLMQHCWEYGFILRYPKDKSAVTGIIYEPWHYRYVGKEAAEEITRAGICLEEYLQK